MTWGAQPLELKHIRNLRHIKSVRFVNLLWSGLPRNDVWEADLSKTASLVMQKRSHALDMAKQGKDRRPDKLGDKT